MFEYIKGSIAELNPAYVVIDVNGLGYLIQISLQTYSALEGQGEGMVYLHHVVREDAELLYGFATRNEREVFRLLNSVSGVGVNTARVILSSLSTQEVERAIITDDVNALKRIKGIGLKTAQRIVVDLKDKVGKSNDPAQIFGAANNTIRDEALSALVMLGFAKAPAVKLIEQLLAEGVATTVEGLIKESLKRL
ncbi:MAG: Holliday junction branch migration protein RuvA [Bacteroidales bacterium]|nr:Holliday junction branch migration protein RuvA [Bacteroidales bacterium]MBN2748433.1 Holliday junction branch migration protein RuvA [Bacteroidales bacterium]